MPGALLGRDIDRLLRSGTRTGSATLNCDRALVVFLICGGFYGAVMATFVLAPDRLALMLFGAIKVPMLFGITMLLAVPSFYVVSALRGVSNDFPKVFALLLDYQLLVALLLAALAPITALVNATTPVSGYLAVQFWNSFAFLLAASIAQLKFAAQARQLVARDSRHRLLLRMWSVLYAFIGIQMAWTLRPFIGQPGQAISFFRPGKLDNAYVEIFSIFQDLLF